MYNELMQRGWRGLLLLMLVLIAMPVARAADEPPIIQKVLTRDYDVQADGRYAVTIHSELRATNNSAAADIGQIPLGYSDLMQDLEIIEAYTLKSSGKKLAVNTANILPQLQPGTPQLRMFDDYRQKVIVFPDLSGGDTVVWTARWRQKHPTFPGQFVTDGYFQRTFAYEKVEITVRAPKAMALRAETHGLEFEQRTTGDKTIYRWRYAAPNALVEDTAALSPYDRLPRYFISSFASYEQLAHAYLALAAEKIQVTPKVKALAEEITAGVTQRRQQAQRIYNWVAGRVRYVSIALGNGGLVPHDADTILANGYGDCKDHTVILAALLKAKGIDSEIVMVNFGNSYTLSEVPTLAQLNHAITWLPEFDLYVDATSGVGPFGTLPIEEYGKPVVHAVATGKAQRAIPILPPGVASVTARTVARIMPDGKITGTSVTSASGPMGLSLRAYAFAIMSYGPERAAKAQLTAASEEGTGSFEVTTPTLLPQDYSVSGHFEIASRAGIVAGESFRPPIGLELLTRPGDVFMGPLAVANLADSESTPCFSGRETEELSLELPDGKRVAQLPKDTRIDNEHIHYQTHWAATNRLVTVRREFTFAIDKSLCTGATRAAAAAALKQIREEQHAQIALTGQ